jgi:anti-anti-sigma factor
MTVTEQHFVVDTHRDGSTDVVAVRGEVDIATVPLLRAVLDAVVARRPARVEVDLSAATLLDAHALTTLVAARRRLSARHAVLALRDPSPVAMRVLRLTRLDLSFDIVDSSLRRAG